MTEDVALYLAILDSGGPLAVALWLGYQFSRGLHTCIPTIRVIHVHRREDGAEESPDV